MKTPCLTVALALVACGRTVYWGDLRASEEGSAGAPASPTGGATTAGATAGWAGHSPGTGGAATGGVATGGAATGGVVVPALRSREWVTPCPANVVVPDSEPQECLPGQTVSFEGVPTDTLILLDRSAAMGETLPGGVLTRWEGVLRGLKAFVKGKMGKSDATLGLTLFGADSPSDECEADTYATPAVAFDDTQEAFLTLLETLEPSQPAGDRPLLPALQGALSYARPTPDPLRVKRVVVVTSGPPSACNESIEQVAEVASVAEAAGVRTFVVQLGADFYLPEIASAGGTDLPFVISQGSVATDIYNILHNLYFNASMSCNFPVEEWAEAGVLQTQQLGVVFRYPSEMGVLPPLDSATECEESLTGGWYFDDPEDPRAIRLCDCSCAEMAEVAEVNILRCFRAL